MATAAQITANRANAQQCTGPNTDEGKAVSSRNSLKHGLTSKQVVLPGEDHAEFELLRETLTSEYKPANTVESQLVDQIAAAMWRKNRVCALESDALTAMLTAPAPDGPEAKQFDRMQRYAVSLDREFHRAVELLRKLQIDRVRNETISIENKSKLADINFKRHLMAVPEIPAFYKTNLNRTASPASMARKR
jgi:hypothetical protein